MKFNCNKILYLKNQRGATSVLVVFMMIVLVTLGAFSISAANVNLKLSKKAIAWNKSFYELDGEGERLVAELDAVLATASGYDAAVAALYELAGNNSWILVSSIGDANGIRVETTLTAANNSDYHLDVGLDVTELMFEGTGQRYIVSKWRQWQDQTDESGSIYWDGKIR